MSDQRSAPSTRHLYRRAHIGEREALELLLKRMRPRLEAWVALHMGAALTARVQAEDVVQEILIKAVGSMDSFEPRGKHAFYGWLFRIARNQIVEWRRRYSAAKRDPGNVKQVHSGIQKDQRGPLTQASEREELDHVLATLSQLSERYREIIRLRSIEYLDNAEAAERLGITPKNASVLYVRAKATLREKLMGGRGVPF